MSAIWGAIDLNANELDEGKVRGMEKVYRSKKIDRIDTFFKSECYLGCGVQFVTKEARKESFPYCDGDKGYFVADANLDNREEVQALLPIALPDGLAGVDGRIMFEAIRYDRNRALNRMCGAYAFAYYDKAAAVLYLVSDAVGNRSVYYRYEEGRVYFSSLLEPLVMLQAEKQVNANWYQNYFGQDNLKVVAEARETPYKGIYRVEPGEIVTFSRTGMERTAYWNPFENRKIIKLASDEEYKKLVCATFKECVESVIREGGETAILLSGGLDSNAVAAYAAPKLKAMGRKLYSFTSVPDKEARRIPNNSYYVEDETEYIEILQKFHENLEPEYVDTSEGDILQENRDILEVLELPFKTVLNMPWIYRAYRHAEQKGCRVVLSGQYGNITISCGDFKCLFATLFRQGKFLRLWKEINAYSRHYRKSRKWILKEVLKTKKEDTFAVYSHYVYDKVALRQVGETELKYSLDTGVIPRDPTRDKRLIELILSLPLEQFVKQGRDRRLVRQYMRDVIPPQIAGDEFHRGQQGVGSWRLLQRQWEQIVPELKKAFSVSDVGEFFDVEDAEKKLSDTEYLFKEENEFEMTKLMYSGLTCEFLEKKYGE